MQELSTADVARHTGGVVEGDSTRTITGVASLDAAGPDDLSFLTGIRYADQARSTGAGAVLLPRSLECRLPDRVVAIRVDDPYAALANVLPLLYPEPATSPGIHPTAVIGEDVKIAENVRLEAFAVIGSGSSLGAGSRIGAQAVVGQGCVIGRDTILHPQVTVYAGTTVGDRCIVHSGARLGADGFGYVFAEGRHRKVPHVGGCRIGDDVEIGANTTIDRGSVGDTVIGKGTKIDNLVQIGHNCRIGEHVIIIAQVGISGSTIIEDFAVMGGQSATAGHLSIGAGARVAGRAAVMGDIAAGETVSGYPARPHREAMRAQAAVLRLPGLLKRIQEIEKKLFGGPEAGAGRNAEHTGSREE